METTEMQNVPNGIEINNIINIEPLNNTLNESSNTSSVTSSPINPGKKVSIKDFEIISELGKGAYAKVVLARYILTNKNIAIKILNKNFIHKVNKSHEALIEREILTSLNHPNIIKLHSTFQDKQKLYFVLDYAPNRDLSTFIRSQGKLSFELARFYAAEIVNAIEYLHSMNIAHRDLKPENMILDINMHIKIVH
jgi:3-phosphoinositide dependent protein kinase-1